MEEAVFKYGMEEWEIESRGEESLPGAYSQRSLVSHCFKEGSSSDMLRKKTSSVETLVSPRRMNDLRSDQRRKEIRMDFFMGT